MISIIRYPITKLKVNVHPRSGHEGPEKKQRYCSVLSLTSTLDGVGGQRHAPSASPPERDPATKVQVAGHGPGFDPRTGQPILSRYTEKAIPVHRYRMTSEKVLDVCIKVKIYIKLLLLLLLLLVTKLLLKIKHFQIIITAQLLRLFNRGTTHIFESIFEISVSDFISKLCLHISLVLLCNKHSVQLSIGGPGSSVGIATVRDRIPVGTRFSARPGRPCGPPSLLYNGYRVFPGG